MHIELIISLVAIVGAAAIALACDFLRARNAQLRRTVAHMKAAKPGSGPAPAPRGPKGTNHPATEAPAEPPSVAARMAGPRPRPALPRGHSHSSTPPRSNAALSAWLIERATVRAADKSASESGVENAAAHTLALVPMPDAAAPVVIDAHLWAKLCAEPPLPTLVSRHETRLELIQGFGGSDFEVRLPAGMVTSAGLSPLLESTQLFTGVVISIGASLAETRETTESVEGFIAGLLRSADCGCRARQDEFVLICPGLQGAEAQRHLSHVSERLWDYQLRTLGKSSVVFSLSGVDVQRENLAEAVVSAKQRMRQTRRTRTEPVAQKRKAG